MVWTYYVIMTYTPHPPQKLDNAHSHTLYLHTINNYVIIEVMNMTKRPFGNREQILRRIRWYTYPDVKAYQTATTREELEDYRKHTHFTNSQGDTYDWYENVKAFYDQVEQKYPGVFIMRDGGDVPYQAFGFIGKYAFYLRSRHGHAQLRVFPAIDSTLTPEELYEQGFDGFFYGYDSLGQEHECYQSDIEVQEFWNGHDIEIWAYLIDNLAPAPFAYTFQTVGVDHDYHTIIDETKEDAFWNHSFTKALVDDPQERIQRGHSPEQAYEKLCSQEGNPWYYQIDREYANPIPLNTDERVFPTPLPDFSVIARTAQF